MRSRKGRTRLPTRSGWPRSILWMAGALAAGRALGVLAGAAGGADDEHVTALAAVGGVGRHDDLDSVWEGVCVLFVGR